MLTGPIVAGGLIFTMDAAGQVTAVTRERADRLEPQPGARRRRSPTPARAAASPRRGACSSSPPASARSGRSIPATGGTLWQRTLEAPIRAAPAVADGRVIVVQRDDTAYALDARNGGTLWRVQGVGGAGLLGGASPAIDGQLAVIPFASGEVLGVLARNGLTVWGTAVTGGRRERGAQQHQRHQRRPGDRRRRGLCLEPERADDPARRGGPASGPGRSPRAPTGRPGRSGGSVFLLSDEGALVRADAATGELLWLVQLPELFPHRGLFGRGKPFKAVAYYGPILAGGRLWVAGADGLLRAFSPADGAALAQLALPGGAAARAGGGRGRDVHRHPRRAASGFPMTA